MAWQDLLPRSDGNAFARTVQLGQQQNAFAAQQRQQQIENARADEQLQMQRTQFNQQQQQVDRTQSLQSVQTVSQVAQRALGIADPAQRKSYLQYAVPAYAKDFAAIGANVEQGLPQMLAMPDDQLQQKLQQVAQLAPPQAPISVAAGTTLIDPTTKKPVYTAPGRVSYEDIGGEKTPVDSVTGVVRSDLPPLKKTAPPSVGGGGFDDPKIQDLQAAISASGYSLPAGFRSQAQQLALMRGLLRKYDGLSPDDIAHLIGTNAIDYKAVTKATQTAASIVGKVEVANNELQAFVPIARDASALVERGNFVPWNKLKQMGESNISDPDLKRLYVATQSILNAYDMLAARGGTDQDKRAHNRAILSSADSPEAYNAALDMIVTEGQAAGKAARESTKASAYQDHGGTPPASGAPSAPAGSGPVRVNTPQEAMALPPGTTFMTPDGRLKVRP